MEVVSKQEDGIEAWRHGGIEAWRYRSIEALEHGVMGGLGHWSVGSFIVWDSLIVLFFPFFLTNKQMSQCITSFHKILQSLPSVPLFSTPSSTQVKFSVFSKVLSYDRIQLNDKINSQS